MILKKIDEVENIESAYERFAINEHGLFYITKDIVIPRLKHIDLKGAGLDKYTSIHLVGDFLIINDFSGRGIVYDVKNDSMVYQYTDPTVPGYGYSPLRFSEKRELLCFKKNSAERIAYIHDVDKNTYKETFSRAYEQYFGGDLFIRRLVSPQSVARMSREGDVLWEYKITGTLTEGLHKGKPDELHGILGVHNNLIWLANESHKLYALDIESGELRHSSTDVGPSRQYGIDRSRDLLLCIDAKCLHKIDIADGKFEHSTVSVKGIFDGKDYQPDSGGRVLPIIGKHLIFYDRTKGVIGTFDTENVRIDWAHKLYEERPHTSLIEVEYCNEILAVRTGCETLHVFEKCN